MKYTFLTGATGLLGAYLMHDMMRAGMRCAVLVRPGRMEKTKQRVDTLLARFEHLTGELSARPVVLEGSLREGLGLGAAETEWVRRNCDRVLHNAASLSFELEPDTNEPYRSNVDGLRHVLDFCKQTGLQNFHHVSTAYVCGLRDGVCREDELDVGQQWGNAYEISKVQGEKMVLGAGFSIPPTFYRPAIITGDSRDGYTSTFHGFYTPLKVASAMMTRTSRMTDSVDLIMGLGMDGQEHKNYVPVEWVSQGIVRLMQARENQGETFHFTPRNRVTVAQMYEVFIKAFFLYFQKHPEKFQQNTRHSPDEEISWNTLREPFRKQMQMYESYWRDDPIFDTAHTTGALPDLPCPMMDEEVLLRLAMFALETNFGWPKPRPFVPDMVVEENLPKKPQFALPVTPGKQSFGLRVNGPGGGQWTVHLDGTLADGNITAIVEGLPAEHAGLIYMSSATFRQLKTRQVTPADAISRGALLWQEPEGDAPAQRMSDAASEAVEWVVSRIVA